MEGLALEVEPALALSDRDFPTRARDDVIQVLEVSTFAGSSFAILVGRFLSLHATDAPFGDSLFLQVMCSQNKAVKP